MNCANAIHGDSEKLKRETGYINFHNLDHLYEVVNVTITKTKLTPNNNNKKIHTRLDVRRLNNYAQKKSESRNK